MKPIVEKFATAYADGIPQFEHNRSYSIDDFAAGMEFWAEIKRDKDSFVLDDCLDEMFSNKPFAVYNSRDNDIEIVHENDWLGDIETHPYYTHWKPIIKPKVK